MGKQLFECSDIFQCAYLRVKYDLKIKDIKRAGSRVSFFFDTGRSSGEDLLMTFYKEDNLVRVNDFVRELRELKSIIHSM